MNLKMEIKGVSDMTRKLEGRIRRLQQSILRKALQAFAEPIRAEAERLARGLISPRLEVVTKIKMRGDSGTVVIGPSAGEYRKTASGRTVTNAMIAYWFEFGYDIRSKPKGPSLRHVGARPSLTPAYLTKKDEGLAAMEQVLRDALEQDVAA